jgi:hypothetical protein
MSNALLESPSGTLIAILGAMKVRRHVITQLRPRAGIHIARVFSLRAGRELALIASAAYRPLYFIPAGKVPHLTPDALRNCARQTRAALGRVTIFNRGCKYPYARRHRRRGQPSSVNVQKTRYCRRSTLSLALPTSRRAFTIGDTCV